MNIDVQDGLCRCNAVLRVTVQYCKLTNVSAVDLILQLLVLQLYCLTQETKV